MTELVTIIGLLLLAAVREFMHYKQVVKLEELLKSIDVTEYYKARGLGKQMERTPVSQTNPIMADEPNDLSSFDEGIDISKVTNINIDGKETPFQIY
jgi:hypothetical protein